MKNTKDESHTKEDVLSLNPSASTPLSYYNLTSWKELSQPFFLVIALPKKFTELYKAIDYASKKTPPNLHSPLISNKGDGMLSNSSLYTSAISTIAYTTHSVNNYYTESGFRTLTESALLIKNWYNMYQAADTLKNHTNDEVSKTPGTTNPRIAIALAVMRALLKDPLAYFVKLWNLPTLVTKSWALRKKADSFFNPNKDSEQSPHHDEVIKTESIMLSSRGHINSTPLTAKELVDDQHRISFLNNTNLISTSPLSYSCLYHNGTAMDSLKNPFTPLRPIIQNATTIANLIVMMYGWYSVYKVARKLLGMKSDSSHERR